MRALGSMETALNITDSFSPLNLVSVARLSDGPSPTDLRKALDALQSRRPELRARIALSGGRPYFEPAGRAPIALQTITPQYATDWQGVAEAELNTRLPSEAGPLARCTYLYRPEAGAVSDVVLTFHHTIVDGGSALGLWRELLALAAGVEPSAPARDTLAPISEQLFPPRFRGWRRRWTMARFMAAQIADELAYQAHSRSVRRPPTPPGAPSARNRLLARRVPAAVTGALVRRCRAERVTLNSALSAALMLAVHRLRYAGQATTLRGITFGSLRPHLQPPVSPEEPGCHIALLRYSEDLSAGQPFWSLARRTQQQVDRMARRDERFAAPLLAPVLVDTTNRLRAVRLAHIAFSYVGAPEMPESFGASRVLELHAFVSNHRLGPEYTATAQLTGGELSLDIVYLDADLERGQAEEIAGEIEKILEAAATSGRGA
jgi:hypothetical protein